MNRHYLGVTTFSSHLVDLGFSDVGTLLSLLQLMLNLSALGQVSVGCLLLKCDRASRFEKSNYGPNKTFWDHMKFSLESHNRGCALDIVRQPEPEITAYTINWFLQSILDYALLPLFL